MKRKAGRSCAKPLVAGQLDLFSRPLPPVTSKAANGSGKLQGATLKLAAGEQAVRQIADPLLDYIYGSERGRGRPQKILNALDASGPEPRRLLDVREAALRLGLSKSTLDKMRCSGRGPRFIRATERAIRYDPADLEAFAAERRRQSTSQDAASAALGA